MKRIKILFGFDEPQFENGVVNYLKSLGYEVESAVKLTKTSIRDFLIANPSYNAAVLLEALNNSRDDNVAKYTADELAMLTDERDINIVIVLNGNHKGSSYMETLYSAGITSAIYQNGRKGGATPKEVATMILHKRSRREAREYYGLGDAPIDLGYLGNDTFAEYYDRLQDTDFGSSLIERFVNVCVVMSKKQVADFIRRLPTEVIDELKIYEEFHVILTILKDSGLNMGIRRPKRTEIGLDTPQTMERARLRIEQNSGLDNAATITAASSAELNKRAEPESIYESKNDQDSEHKSRMPANEESSKEQGRSAAMMDEMPPFNDLVLSLFGDDEDDVVSILNSSSADVQDAGYNDEYRFSSIESNRSPLPDITSNNTDATDTDDDSSSKENKKKKKKHQKGVSVEEFISDKDDDSVSPRTSQKRGHGLLLGILVGIGVVNTLIGVVLILL